ncbi:MAG: hypothetical protein OEZ47_17080, partial [Gammaproteobacteria bacterium]|nr:hypothetical protein [Gammaproteobacteria bacterium]
RTRTAMLKGSNILEPGAPFYSSDDQKYQVLLKYKNESNAPIVVDYHDSNALIENKNYKIDLTAPSFGRSSISWSFYDNSSQVFSGPQGDSMTQITLNPNQEFTGQLKFAIPGLKILKKAEAENMTLKIGGVEYTGFERMIAYDALMDD